MLSPLQGAVLAWGDDPVAILFVRGKGPISRGKGAREMEHPAVSGLVIYAVPDGTRFLFRRLPSPLRPGLRYAAAAAAVAWRTRRYLLQASLECLVSSRLAMEYPEPSRDGNSVGEHALG